MRMLHANYLRTWHDCQGLEGQLPSAVAGLRVGSVIRAKSVLAGISKQVASQLAEGKLR